MQESFYFYDLETSGLNPRADRIMQFAGQRTDLNFRPLGEPVNLLIELSDDTLPSPSAIMVTGITPQSTRQDGLSERDFAKFFIEEVATPRTIIMGYNSLRFDDEFIRATMWRNFYDVYAWQWKDRRSRWDLLDVVRLTRALRPEGIEWPFTPDGKPTNRLELLTKLNHISHEHAHDALADVVALIEVTKLIKTKQPQLFNFLFELRKKPAVRKLANLAHPQPFVYASGRYPSEFEKTTVAYPLAEGPNGNLIVFDLRYNLDELLAAEQDGTYAEKFGRARYQKPKSAPGSKTASSQPSESSKQSSESAKVASNSGASVQSQEPSAEPSKSSKKPAEPGKNSTDSQKPSSTDFFPIVKVLQYNHCPAIAPLGVLEKADGWKKISLDQATIEKNLAALRAHPEFAARMAESFQNRGTNFAKPVDAESAVYDGEFLSEKDELLCSAVRSNTAEDLANFHPKFADPRLPELLLHYKAKNFPTSLSADEVETWEQYRTARLARQAPKFLAELQGIQKDLAADRPWGNKTTEECAFLAEELMLWYESLQPSDF